MDQFDRRFLLPVKAKRSTVILVAEHLRQRLYADGLIKSRWYLLRNFSNCVVGRELVDWLVQNGEACNRTVAVQCIRILQDNYLIHHGMCEHKIILFVVKSSPQKGRFVVECVPCCANVKFRFCSIVYEQRSI